MECNPSVRKLLKSFLLTVCMLALALLFLAPLEARASSGYYKTPQGIKTTSYSNGDSERTYTLKIKGSKIIWDVTNLKDTADTYVLSCGCTSPKDHFSEVTDGKTELVHELDAEKTHTITLWAAVRDENGEYNYTYLENVVVRFLSGSYCFYNGAGKSEKTFFASLDKNRKLFTGVGEYDKMLYNLAAIKSKVKSLTKNCKTNTQKVKAFHDWIASNIRYDYTATADTMLKREYADEVFKTKLAVCGGYADLMKVFCDVANIPCIECEGGIISSSIKPGKKVEYTHRWNAVYLNGKWLEIDVCWDSKCSYYGKNNSNNVSRADPKYTYYLLTPVQMGKSHFTMFLGTHSYSGSYIGYYGGYGKTAVYRVVNSKKRKVSLYKVYGYKKYAVWYEFKLSTYAKTRSFTIIGIKAGAFARDTKLKTLKLVCPKLQTARLKNCLKGSKIKTVYIYKYSNHLTRYVNYFKTGKSGRKTTVVVTKNYK